ncbi:MAG: hypothetical protein HC879_12305 [Leptolyngbyaceae cyanobacterium SL_5_9]|nr:hypothetical protein [Leptolyngbyaceae cyanobacterium SL_5_9]NJO72346.1 hypothetical protein [Leptolyngbyaceae cyanobacterium RM1_406_9]
MLNRVLAIESDRPQLLTNTILKEAISAPRNSEGTVQIKQTCTNDF